MFETNEIELLFMNKEDAKEFQSILPVNNCATHEEHIRKTKYWKTYSLFVKPYSLQDEIKIKQLKRAYKPEQNFDNISSRR